MVFQVPLVQEVDRPGAQGDQRGGHLDQQLDRLALRHPHREHRLLELLAEEPNLRFGEPPQVLAEVARRRDPDILVAPGHGEHRRDDAEQLQVVLADPLVGRRCGQLERHDEEALRERERQVELGARLFQRPVRCRHRVGIEQVAPAHRVVPVGDQRADVVQADPCGVHGLRDAHELDVGGAEPVRAGRDDGSSAIRRTCSTVVSARAASSSSVYIARRCYSARSRGRWVGWTS